MKVLTLNRYDVKGGASRAAYRIHKALRTEGIDSRMLVNESLIHDETVEGPGSYSDKFIVKVRHALGELVTKILITESPVLHSPALLPSNWPNRINSSNADIVHMHWINYEMLSVEDIARIKKPVVWTLHDMWPFCGAEHYAEDFRWREGYKSKNRPGYERGGDLNRWTWHRKIKTWQKPMHIVTPSNWLSDCAKNSLIMQDWPICVIHNTIDTNFWCPLDKKFARQVLQLPQDVPLLSFGAVGGTVDQRKGFDLLKGALDLLRGEIPNLELVIFGESTPKIPLDYGFPVHYSGHLQDDISLIALYNAIDVLVIPSRQDNLPNTGVESLACGTPVVAFNICGLPDIVSHLTTGYLAKPFDKEDLAYGIKWVFEDSARYNQLSEKARETAVDKFSYKTIAKQYRKIYASALYM
ncbi:MAG: glycosyl transferase [Methylomonas sp.]|nr:MAG: glycosyl transferase [Methylomonas sp.]